MTSSSHLLKLAAVAVLAATCGAWWTGCNQHPVDYSSGSAAIEHRETIPASGEAQLDMLWVLDNSGSMCEEQQELRDEFTTFLESLTQKPIDFHMAVTTTHFNPEFPLEKVARAGQIQSTPHPPVGSNEACRFKRVDGENEDPQYDFTPAKRQIEAAVKCTKEYTDESEDFPDELRTVWNPEDNEVAWSKDALACALLADQDACDAAGKDPQNFRAPQLFPCAQVKDKRCDKSDFQDVYRDIGKDKVLRARDYRNEDGSLRSDEFIGDFRCMSYVGTRGDGQEEGLHAATRAVSPRMTGGPVGDPIEDPSTVQDEGESWSYPENDDGEADPTKAPNHGFLRKDANTAVIFISDENDCSRPSDVDLVDRYSCGEMNCYFAAKETRNGDGPLHKTGSLADRFMENLADSKKVDEVAQEDVFMASIHGNSDPYEGEITTDCGGDSDDIFGNLNVCNTELGTAKTGDRYESFLREFERVLPNVNEGDTEGYMCNRDGFAEPLQAVAGSFQGGSRTCIPDHVTCSESSECPAFRYGADNSDDSGGSDNETCQDWPGSGGGKYCRSAMQVRLRHTGDIDRETAVADLKDSGLCYEESLETNTDPRGCVVRRDAYSWDQCEGNSDAVALTWNPADITNPARRLANFEIEIRYTEITGGSTDGQGGDGGGDGDAASMMSPDAN
jgi:hypothetical protein